MLLINDKKDSYGFFSKFGKKTTKENLLLLQYEKKILLKKESKSLSSSNLNLIQRKYYSKLKGSKKYNSDVFTIEEPDKEKLDDIAKDIIQKKIQKKNNENKNKKININKSFIHSLKENPRYHYYNIHSKTKKRKEIIPSCRRYNPKYDAILRRQSSCLLWKTITGRKDSQKNYNFPFYLNHDLVQDNMAGKSFIDFSKQTIRKCYEDENIHKKKINIKKKTNESIIKNKRPLSCRNKYNNLINKKPSYDDKNNNDISNTNISNDSYELFKHAYTRKLKKKGQKTMNMKKKQNEEKKKKNKSTNFTHIVTKHTSCILKKNKVPTYISPNYSMVRERPIMMVVYDRKKHMINKNKSEILSKNNHHYYSDIKKNNLIAHSPNFDLMTSRPYDDNDPLPIYMKNIYDKNNCYEMTNISLKLNNYSNRGFSMIRSSFWPKNSFNKYLNLNFLKSKKNFYKSLLLNKANNEKEYKILEKSFNFYIKNYNNITVKENLSEMNKLILNRFLNKNNQ